MSTTRRARKCSGTSEPELYLPVDLLLEIVSRSDVTTVVRCTTASRILRRAILDPAFRHRLAADGGGFDPALLLGVSYRAIIFNIHGRERTHRVIHTLSATKPRTLLDASCQRDFFDPVASRDGLLLLRRPYCLHPELRVCDTLTGHAASLPQIAMSCTFGHVFVNVGHAGESYELVVADTGMRFQKFSSKQGQWGVVNQISITDDETNRYQLCPRCPAVIGRTVYWSCRRHDNGGCCDRILAMDVDTAAGTIMKLPSGRMMDRKLDTHHLLASVCGFLSLLVVESSGITMWTLTPASSPDSSGMWSRQLVFDKVEIQKMVKLVDFTLMHCVLQGFGERSGAVIVQVGKGNLLRLNLGTKVVKRLRNEKDALVSHVFLHEIDLVSLLQGMKYA